MTEQLETRTETDFEYESVKLFESHAIEQNKFAKKCLQDTAINAIAYPVECGELA
jgi:hypothetical protein